jgi:hypothetical protein
MEVAMDYPQDFPAESRAKVEAARIRAGCQFDFKRTKVKWSSDIEALFWTYVLTPFVVFAGESSRLGLWSADEMDRNCREFLRRLTIHAYYQKGKAAGLRDMISNWNGSILWEAQQEIEKTSQWRKYENICLKFAVKGGPATQSTEIIPGQVAGLTAGEREKFRPSRDSTLVPANPYFPDLCSQTDTNQTESSSAQNSDKTTQNVESKSRNPETTGGRAYSHRIPLVILKCISPNRWDELAARRRGEEPGGGRLESRRYGHRSLFRSGS